MADQYAPIVCQLEQDANAVRIKKLILYACKNWWENDLDRLSVVSLQSLVQELRYLNPTLEHLQYKLKLLVGTLSKQEEYLQVANTIIEKLAGLYRTAPAIEKTTVTTNPLDGIGGESQAQITQALEQQANSSSRVKKLMICAAHKYWETDPIKVEQAEIKKLIGELAHQYPTIESLQIGLAAIVKSLSKPIEYASIANMILREMSRLYVQEAEVLLESVDNLTAQALDQPVCQATDPAISLFDMRLEIVKSANPLRAKILLFSLVYYPFTGKEEDWSNLKLYSLEGLLRSVTTVCSSLEALQLKLEEAAHQLSQSDDYLAVASVIVKSVKPGYAELQQQVKQALDSSADVTRADSTQVLRAPVSKSALRIGNRKL